jgi:hypothetical protein
MNRTAYKTKRNQITCRCAAYKFPHRQDSKACKELYNESLESGYEKDSYQSLGLVSLFAPDNSHLIRC